MCECTVLIYKHTDSHLASGSKKIVTQLNVLKETGSSAYKHLCMTTI